MNFRSLFHLTFPLYKGGLRGLFYFAISQITISPFNLCYSQSWTQLPTTNNPPPRANSSAVYESAGNRIIVFGGRQGSVSLNDVWALSLSTIQWQQLSTSGGPPSPRFTHNAFFDVNGNRMIIWSGQGNGGALYNDVWALNLANNTWQQLWPDGNVAGVPLRRYGTAAVFDPSSRRFVTFAGFTTSGRFEDTWYFQVDSLRWMDETTPLHPPLRCLHTACFEPTGRKMFIFGGQNIGALDDIWSLDLVSFGWTELSPAIRPPARFWTASIFAGDKVIIHGGQDFQQTFGDLWRFNIISGTWDSIPQGAVRPSARTTHAAVYIPQSDKLIIFGGADTTLLNDTWEFSSIGAIGIEKISSRVSTSFYLYQNFPNPFNVSTKIKFDVPQFPLNTGGLRGLLNRLIIYNILGREVAVLVNQVLEPGSYEVIWNADDYPSGVYFFRLSSGDFSESRKMLLIR